jgi:hypothetical protein
MKCEIRFEIVSSRNAWVKEKQPRSQMSGSTQSWFADDTEQAGTFLLFKGRNGSQMWADRPDFSVNEMRSTVGSSKYTYVDVLGNC